MFSNPNKICLKKNLYWRNWLALIYNFNRYFYLNKNNMKEMFIKFYTWKKKDYQLFNV